MMMMMMMMSGECRGNVSRKGGCATHLCQPPACANYVFKPPLTRGKISNSRPARLDVASGRRPSRRPLLGAARRLPPAHFATRSDAPVSALTPDRCLRPARAPGSSSRSVAVATSAPAPVVVASSRGIRRGESTRAAHAPPSPRRRHERHQRHLGSSAGASRARSPANAPPGTPRSSPAPRSLRGAAIVVARARCPEARLPRSSPPRPDRRPTRARNRRPPPTSPPRRRITPSTS